jgi:NifU-like protein involved in Fe-S cluster formation
MSMQAESAYPAAVWRRFREPGHAAAPAAGARRGRGGERKQGGELELWLSVDGGTVRQAGFRAFGCPYLIASADAACEALAGKPVAALLEFDAGALIQELQVPPERFPVKIWLEDAVRAAAREA